MASSNAAEYNACEDDVKDVKDVNVVEFRSIVENIACDANNKPSSNDTNEKKNQPENPKLLVSTGGAAVTSDDEDAACGCSDEGETKSFKRPFGSRWFDPGLTDIERARIQFEEATDRNRRRYEHQVATGEFIPEEELKRRRLERNLTEEEDQERREKERVIARKKMKREFLQNEVKLCEIDTVIKSEMMVGTENVNEDAVLHAMYTLKCMALSSLMLKRNPEIIKTIAKCSKYIRSPHIMSAANKVYMRFLEMFPLKEDELFIRAFNERMQEYNKVLKEREENGVSEMEGLEIDLRHYEVWPDTDWKLEHPELSAQFEKKEYTDYDEFKFMMDAKAENTGKDKDKDSSDEDEGDDGEDSEEESDDEVVVFRPSEGPVGRGF